MMLYETSHRSFCGDYQRKLRISQKKKKKKKLRGFA